jgi:hypothetical protein
MPKSIGRVAQFGLAKETVRGTPETAATFWLPNSDLKLEEKQGRIMNEQSLGLIEDSYDELIATQWAEAEVKGPVTDKAFGLLLYNMLGGLVTTTNADASTTVKDHTFSVAQNAQHQALSLFLDDPAAGQDYKHALGMISSLGIEYQMGEYVTFNAKLKAKKGATATLTPATNNENRFTHKHVVFKIASNLAGLTAASPVIIKSFKLDISTDLEDDFVLGSVDPADFLNKGFSVSGTLEAFWQNETDYKTAYLANTNKALRIDIANTDVVIGTAANPTLRIDLAKVFFEELTKPYSLNDVVKQTLKFKAVYSISDSSMISAKLTNLQASY